MTQEKAMVAPAGERRRDAERTHLDPDRRDRHRTMLRDLVIGYVKGP